MLRQQNEYNVVITSFPRQFLVIEASEFSAFVNVKSVALALLNSSTTGTLGFPSCITLAASWRNKNITNGAFSDQPMHAIK